MNDNELKSAALKVKESDKKVKNLGCGFMK